MHFFCWISSGRRQSGICISTPCTIQDPTPDAPFDGELLGYSYGQIYGRAHKNSPSVKAESTGDGRCNPSGSLETVILGYPPMPPHLPHTNAANTTAERSPCVHTCNSWAFSGDGGYRLLSCLRSTPPPRVPGPSSRTPCCSHPHPLPTCASLRHWRSRLLPTSGSHKSACQ